MNVHSGIVEIIMNQSLPDKKAAALKAALELISEQGFHGTPMSQVAQRANIGVGTIYRYFAGKEDMINALYIDIKTRITKYILRNYSEDLPVRDGFKQLFRGIVHYCIENPAELSFAEQYENSPLITAATRLEGSRIAEPLNNLFKRAMDQNLLKELPFEMVGALIYGAIIALVKLYLSGKETLDESALDKGLDAVWDMIKR
jgi:AcrR family transcriptional regulator